jgi:cytidine deaminase
MSSAHASELIERARKASGQAYAPYSGFRVGAAVLGAGGGVFTGCNVENASYGLTVCAERVAVFCAVAAGERRLAALALYVDADEPAPPCGACLQVLREFAQDLPIYLAGRGGGWKEMTLGGLYPMPFGPGALGERHKD